jgi:cytochrome P450
MRIGPPSFEKAAGFCAQQSIERQQSDSRESKPTRRKDMLDDFLELKRKNLTQMDDMGVVSALLVNILAGSDTTANLLRSIVYYGLKNPNVHRKLQRELDEAELRIPVRYTDASKLPYLSAVIRESSRINPGVALMLERIVPDSGLELADGTILPPGVKVGMNAWVVHRDKNVYGQDADSFRPKSWLREEEEAEETYQERVANMKRHDFTYGAGKRGCLGKHVTLLETYKLVASLFLKYNVSSFFLFLRGVI